MSELVRITASAGAGKTYRLALRYIDLLAKNKEVLKKISKGKKGEVEVQKALKSIVAITFTNKAAAEMKERILRFLKEIAFDTEEGRNLARQLSVPLSPEEARRWVDAILEYYSCFQVRTIDSLLFSILRALSFELDLASELEVIFNKEKVLEEAFERLLYLAALDEGRSLWEDILNIYLEVDEKGGFYPEYGIRERLKDLYDVAVLERKIELFRGSCGDIKELRERYKEAYKALFEALGEEVSDVEVNLEKQHPEEILSKIEARFGEKIPENVMNLWRQYKSAWDELKNAEIERCYQRVSGYAEALNKLKELVNEICLERGIVVGGEDWTFRVREKLSDEAELIPFVYAVFATQFRHFLFDEFQDTSRAQFEALKPIIEDAVSSGGSLFMVGDVKQAIFGWRGGDSSLFFTVPQELQAADKNFQVLDGNYRSAKELVEFFNKVFRRLEDKKEVRSILNKGNFKIDIVKEQLAEDISQAFENCSQKPKAKGVSSGEFEIFLVEARRKDDLRKVVEEKVIEILKSRWNPAESTAILVRNNSDAEEVSRWLYQNGFPVVTENSLRLKSSFVVTGLLNLMDYLYRDSEASLYGFLASGLWENYSEEEIFNKWIEDKDQLAEKVKERFEKEAGFYRARSPYEALRTLMDALELEERLDGDLAGHKPFVERLLDVAHLFEVEEEPSIGKFLEYAKEEGFDSRVGLPDDMEAIQVITIHKAKGLEFDTVFVPFTDWSQVDRAPITFHNGKMVRLGGIVKLDEELGALREGIFGKTLKEHINLFYVALTRAKKRLYLFITKRSGDFMSVAPLVEEIIKGAGYGEAIESLGVKQSGNKAGRR